MDVEGKKLTRKKRPRVNSMDMSENCAKSLDTETFMNLPPSTIRKPSASSQDLLSLFTDCMSALSTNKICSRNAFDVGIIDHMTDLVHLGGESDEEDSVDGLEFGLAMDAKKNKRLSFTRASKVVEGASRIYGYRVEAIYDKAYNVLMNMNNVTNQEDIENIPTKSKIRNRKLEFTDGSKTLHNEVDVTLMELPIDNTILDPYFLKVSSMFDQSGVQGLLLTNLLVSDDLSLSLDGNNSVFTEVSVGEPKRCVVDIDGPKIKAHSTKMDKRDFNKLEILPEVSCYRNELQKLIEEYNVKVEQGGDKDGGERPEGALKLDASFDVSPVGDEVVPGMDTSFDMPSDVSFDLPEVPELQDLQAVGDFNLSLMERLEAIDLQGGSEFSYYSSDLKLKTRATHPRPGELKKRDEKLKGKRVLSGDIRCYMDNSLADELDGVELLLSLPVKGVSKRAFNSLAADDYSGLKYKFSESFFSNLCIVSNRALKFSNQGDWRLRALDKVINPVLQVYYTNDPDLNYSYKINMNWTEYDEIRVDEDYELQNYDYNDYELNNLHEVSDEPMNISIDQLYENDFNHMWNSNMPSHDELTAGSDSKDTKDILPATFSAYIDIFKIKKTLCNIVVPSPEFNEVIEEEAELQHAQTNAHRESQILFKTAIDNTLNKLNTNDCTALNSHIMFVCLLHVCNEQNLLLRQSVPLNDFLICSNAPMEQHLGDYYQTLGK